MVEKGGGKEGEVGREEGEVGREEERKGKGGGEGEVCYTRSKTTNKHYATEC